MVPELFADRFSVDNIKRHLIALLPGTADREKMLAGYEIVRQRLGTESAPDNAARVMVDLLKK